MDWSSIIGGFGSGALQGLTGQPQGGGPQNQQQGMVPGFIPRIVKGLKKKPRQRYQPMGPTDQQLGADPNAGQYGIDPGQSPQFNGWDAEDM